MTLAFINTAQYKLVCVIMFMLYHAT